VIRCDDEASGSRKGRPHHLSRTYKNTIQSCIEIALGAKLMVLSIVAAKPEPRIAQTACAAHGNESLDWNDISIHICIVFISGRVYRLFGP
jgi:hypothetical protein